MQTSTLLGVVVIIILIVAGGWYFYTNPAPTPAPAGDTGTPTSPGGSTSGDTTVNLNVTVGDPPTSANVIYGGSGFSPVPVRVKLGGTVTFVDQNPNEDMWVASAQHPTHTVYNGTTLAQHCAAGAVDSFDQCAAGSSYSFTFNKVGTWNYHNHLQSSHFGSVEVVQ